MLVNQKDHKIKMTKTPPLVTIRPRKCKAVKPLPSWKRDITMAPDPLNENACLVSFELGDRLHLQRMIRKMTVRAVNENSAAKRLVAVSGQEAYDDIWHEVTEMVRIKPEEEILKTHYDP